MFEAEIKKVINQYLDGYRYIKKYLVDQQKVEILKRIEEKIPSAFTVVADLIAQPKDSAEIQNYLNKLPLLKKCFQFIRQEKISPMCFNLNLTSENRDKFSEEVDKLYSLILATEAEPYFKYIFETLPTREARANAIFTEETTND